MKYTIYLGATVKLKTEAELAAMLIENKLRNREAKINGMLIYAEGNFIQVLEGDEEEVKKAGQKIEQNTDNKNIIKLTENTVSKPNFRNWTMAFLASNRSLVNQLEGYISPESNNFLNTDSTHTAIMLLKSFVTANRIAYVI